MKRIMIIGVGWEQIPLVNKAKNKGLFVIATTWWIKEEIPADKIYTVDSRDLDGLEAIIIKEKPDYILADECDYSMYAVAYFSQKYRMRGPSLKTQTITNNKFLQRECVKITDVMQPAYRLCWNLDMAKSFAAEIGYPIVVKPIDNRGSIGISKVMFEEELASAWLLAVSHSHSRICIVEKCIYGNVITADGFFDSETFEFIAASTKDMYKDNDNVAKILYYPGSFANDIAIKIKRNSELIAKAVGIDYGFAHIEFIQDSFGNLYFVEIANRGGGVFISNIILEQITGIDYANALLDLAMGKKVKVKCGQKYISKAILYFLELKGNTPLRTCITEIPKECKAIYVNTYHKESGVASEASVGRQGVVVYSGQDFEILIEKGVAFEEKYCAETKEFLKLF